MIDERFDLASVRLFLSRQALRSRAGCSSAVEEVPGLPRVRSQHREDGWMHLIFDEWDVAAASRVANLVLDPDASTFLVLGPVCVFDGFAPDGDDGSGVPAALTAGPPPAAGSHGAGRQEFFGAGVIDA